MASRFFWVLMVGLALVGSIAMQGRWLFSVSHDAAIERSTERMIEERVERSLENKFSKMEVVGSDGRRIEVAEQTKRELGDAVRRLITAEADLAIMRMRGGGDGEASEARSRRDAARADVDRLKGEIERQKELSDADRDLMREQIQHEIRASIRETIRSAVRR